MNGTMHRRQALKLGIATAATVALSGGGGTGHAAASAPEALATRAIPASGERLPVIGLGTNNYSPTNDAERAARRAVLGRLTASGASVIDTAPAYRESERTVGELLAELGNRDRAFIATKPSYTQFEAWIKTQPGVKLDQASIDKNNADIRGYNHGDDVRAGIFAATGLSDSTCSVRGAIELNNLDDWATFHKEVLS